MSLLLVADAMLMVVGRVPANGLYGARTAKTLANPAVWEAANRMGGKALHVAGVVPFLVTLALLLVARDLSLATLFFFLAIVPPRIG